jgi:23S rRNA (cytidine1920-2'-O)/16S rRNA (cytidine1409-2'-O)-methyltransferase
LGITFKIVGNRNRAMNRKSKIRCDQLLFAKGLSSSLDEARALIMAGKVVVNDQRVDLPSQMVAGDAAVRVRSKKFVSRGGEKLMGALEDFGLVAAIRGRAVLDIGCSTGGFTDCCLKLGATKVFAVDVGTNVLDWSLRQDPRVELRENCDIRQLSPADIPPVDLVVADISFNSLQILMPSILRFGNKGGTLFVLLVKPQFELPREEVPQGGVIEDEAARRRALMAVEESLHDHGIKDYRWSDSKVSGRKGNVEIFVHFIGKGPNVSDQP